MAADAWKAYNTFRLYVGEAVVNLNSDTFKMVLCTSASNANDPTVSLYGSLTNELSTLHGYTAGGQTCTVTWTQSTVTVTFDSNDQSWTASGGSLVFRYAVIYDNTPSSPLKPLVCWSLLDNAPADITIADGNTLTIQINASGVFTLTGM